MKFNIKLPSYIKNYLSNHSIIGQFKQIINNIILNRIKGDKNKVSILTGNGKIDDLPSQLIGEIGSYLDQNSYTKFTRCNRSLFISLSSPNTLQSIKISKFKDYSDCNRIELENYPQIKSLYLPTSKLNVLALPSHKICNRLKYILIDCYIDSISQFLDQDAINLSNLREASIFLPYRDITQDTFHHILKKVSAVHTMFLSDIKFGPEPTSQSPSNLLLPNLRELRFYRDDIGATTQWLQAYGPQLESLIFGGCTSYPSLPSIALPKLTTLLLNTGKNLKELSIKSTWNNLNIKDVINHCIIDKSLEVARFVVKNGGRNAECRQKQSDIGGWCICWEG